MKKPKGERHLISRLPWKLMERQQIDVLRKRMKKKMANYNQNADLA